MEYVTFELSIFMSVGNDFMLVFHAFQALSYLKYLMNKTLHEHSRVRRLHQH